MQSYNNLYSHSTMYRLLESSPIQSGPLSPESSSISVENRRKKDRGGQQRPQLVEQAHTRAHDLALSCATWITSFGVGARN
jgi:hypothetical protein